jgi:hypothetical protein
VKAFPEFCFIGSGTFFAGHWSLNVSANGRFFYLFSITHPNAGAKIGGSEALV